jgi:O-antigen/teichoic acid export membrane protein
VVASGRVQWLALAWAAPYALTVLPAWRAARPGTGEESGSAATAAPPEVPSHKQLWSFSAPRAMAALSQIIIQRLDIVLVAVLRGVRDAALYTAATRFLVLGQLVNQAIGLPLQPRLGVLLARQDLEGADDLYAVATSWTIGLAWPLYLTFAVYASPSLAVFGHGYTGAGDVVVLLSLAMLVATACGPVDLMLIMAGRTAANLANTIASLTVFLIADLTLIPRYGASGAAIGWSLAIATNNVLPLLQVRHHLGCWPLRRPAVLTAGAAVTCFAAIPLIAQGIAGTTWSSFVVAAVIGTLAYLAALRWLREPLRLTGVAWRRTAGSS